LYVREKWVQRALSSMGSPQPSQGTAVNPETTSATTPSADQPRRPWRRGATATLIGGLAAGIGAKALAHGGPGGWHGGWGGGRGWHGGMGPRGGGRRAGGG